MMWMNLEPITLSEATPKKEKQLSYTNTCIWSLERWY